MFKNFIKKIKDRKVRKWLAIYTSSTLPLIGLTHLLSIRYQFPATVFDVMIILIITGFPVVAILSWYHSGEESGKMSLREIIILSFIGIVSVALVVIRVTKEHISILPPDAKTIAVLPFQNLSGDKQDDYFADGITEDILTQLSKIKDLKVISRTSVMKYKNTELSISQIGRELGAGSILEGSIRRENNRIRIVSQLINARADEHIWANTYDREMKDIFTIQSEVAQSIANALKAQLSPKEKQNIQTQKVKNIDAYAYYLKGRESYKLYTKIENENAIALFNKAISIDSTYSLAYAGLADAYSQRYQRFGYSKLWVDSAITLSLKAISINSNAAEPFKALGSAYALKGWYNKALEQYNIAVGLNPNYSPAVTNIANLNCWIGRYEEAYPWVEKSFILNPGRESAYRAYAYMFMGLEMDSLSESWYKRVIELNPYFNLSIEELIKLYIMKKEYIKARKLVNNFLADVPNDKIMLTAAGNIELFAGKLDSAKKNFEKAFSDSAAERGPATELGYLYLMEGKRNKALKLFEYSISKDSAEIKQGSENFQLYYDLARINSLNNDTLNAVRNLSLAIDYGWRYYRWTLEDPMLVSIRNNKSFDDLMKNLNSEIVYMRKAVKEKMEKNNE